ncbi:MAG: SDR family NAD(P)-dependent oxidoreductase [Solirubrobacterales bacterium]
MADRAALITGGSSGIGLAMARALGEDGYGVTVSSRRPEKLEAAAEELRSAGIEVESIAANMVEDDAPEQIVAAHEKRFGRLDVLCNNAGVGIGQAMEELGTKQVDIQIGTNLRGLILTTREALPMLRKAGAEHSKALIANTASIAGKRGEGWLSVYSATKAAVIGFSQATQKEVANDGIQVTALCPAFVDTPMTDFVKESVKAEEMIRPEDIAETLRLLLKTSPACLIPELVFMRPGDAAGGGP